MNEPSTKGLNHEGWEGMDLVGREHFFIHWVSSKSLKLARNGVIDVSLGQEGPYQTNPRHHTPRDGGDPNEQATTSAP